MKRILVCMIISVISISFIAGCLPGRGVCSANNRKDSSCSHSVPLQVAESIIIYGYVFLPANREGVVRC